MTLSVKDIREQFKQKLANEEFVIDRTGVKTIEIMNANFNADEELIYGTVNNEWYNRELNWYLSQSLNVYDIEEPVPTIWQQIADKDGLINSNYGWCIFSDENHNQYDWALHELRSNPDSRRAQMIYTRPAMNKDYNHNGRNDFMCCSNTIHLIRNNKLHSLVYFRSSDAVFGYKGDYFWANYVHNKLANELKIDAGDIIWNAASLHIYERHFYLIGE